MPADKRTSALPILIVVAALAVLAVLAAVLPEMKEEPSVATPTGSPPPPTDTPTVTPRPTRTYTFTPTPTSTNTFTPLPPIIYVVKSGDVLSIIARDHGVTTRALLEANNLSEDAIIQPGQELIIPRPTPTAEPQATPVIPSTTQAADTPVSTGEAPLASGEQIYIVESGDTLSGIAIKFDVSVNLLMNRNNITDPSLLRVGQTIIIPVGTPTPSPSPTLQPTRTPTLGPPYPAPALLWPPDGTVYRGEDATVLVQWTAVGYLRADEWYVVRVRRGGEVVGEGWTKANAWRLPAELRPPADAADHRLAWEVLITRQEGLDTGKGTVLVPAGETRWLEWY